MTKKVVSIVGARPQFVKLAPLSKQLRQFFHEVIVHTGQHYDQNLSDRFFSDLDIPKPDHHLGVGSAGHATQTARILEKLEPLLQAEKPDLVVVFGDTNSTLAGALAAVKIHLPLLHVEAGLRSFNRRMPEEINRIVTDHIADHLFAPTKTAMDNLNREGLGNRSSLTGDIMADAILDNVRRAIRGSDILDKLELSEGRFCLLTLHRPSNVDDPVQLQAIIVGIGKLDMPVVWPIHPRTEKMLRQFNSDLPENIRIIQPQGYLDFIRLQSAALKILTDSGGIQKEAFILKKPCITLRTETEWVETVQAGWNRLLSADDPGFADIVNDFVPPEAHPDFFGYRVGEKMRDQIQKMLTSGSR